MPVAPSCEHPVASPTLMLAIGIGLPLYKTLPCSVARSLWPLFPGSLAEPHVGFFFGPKYQDSRLHELFAHAPPEVPASRCHAHDEVRVRCPVVVASCAHRCKNWHRRGSLAGIVWHARRVLTPIVFAVAHADCAPCHSLQCSCARCRSHLPPRPVCACIFSYLG